ITNVGGVAFFNANDGAHGREVWKSDGTAPGTALVDDISPGPIGSAPRWLVPSQGRLYLQANDGTHGTELWEADSVVDNTTTTLTSSKNPSTFGQPLTLTAKVTDPLGATPTGAVTFTDGTKTLGIGTLSGRRATFTTSALAVGSRAITATYHGSGSYITSVSPALSQVVNKANTTTALASSVNSSVTGQAVTFTATVAPVTPGAGVPTGTVTF